MRNVVRFLVMLLLIGLSASILCADKPKSFDITLHKVYKIGDTELQPGNYKIVVHAPTVRFTQLSSGKAVDIEAKVETLDSKIEQTTIHSKQVDGASQISEIHVGGSKTRIAFE